MEERSSSQSEIESLRAEVERLRKETHQASTAWQKTSWPATRCVHTRWTMSNDSSRVLEIHGDRRFAMTRPS